MKVGKSVKTKEADYAVENINNLAQVVPEIWVSATDGGDQTNIKRSVSGLDSVIAGATTAVGA